MNDCNYRIKMQNQGGQIQKVNKPFEYLGVEKFPNCSFTSRIARGG